MDRTEKNRENLNEMVEQMKKKLQLVNSGLIQGDDYELEQFEEIKELYNMVMNMPSFSVRDLEGIVSELGNLKHNKNN